MTTTSNLNWIRRKIKDATFLLCDGTCRTGGLLTVEEDFLQKIADKRCKQGSSHRLGQEINAEAYKICKANLLLNGESKVLVSH